MARFTGERILPDNNTLKYTFARHEVVYQAIARHVRGLRLLDCGCGEGYGSALLAREASSVIGIDRSPEAISDAQRRYTQANLAFQPQDLESPWHVATAEFDAAACCQVIEHLAHPEHLLQELSRVLRPSGWAVISTPNRRTFSPTGDMLDPYHVREYDRQEYQDLLSQFFPAVRIYALTGNTVVLDHLRRDMITIRRVVRADLLGARRWLPMPTKRWLYDLGLNGLRKLQQHHQQKPVHVNDFSCTAEPIPDDQVLDLIAVVGNTPSALPVLESSARTP